MKIVIRGGVALFLAFCCSNAISQGKQSLLQNPETQLKINKYCQETHWRSPQFVSVCMQNQIEALAKVENYLELRWQVIKEDRNHPVLVMFANAVKESPAVVEGKPWVDWTMAKFRFKRSMQDWLRAEGKAEELRIISSAL